MGGCSFLYFKYNILAAPKQAFLKKSKKVLAICISLLYNNPCCDIDSVEAEVAAHMQVISWSECQLKITGDKSLYLYHPLLVPVYKVSSKPCRTEMTCEKECLKI